MLNSLCSVESEITNMIILQVESCDRIILNVMKLNWFKEYSAVKMNTGDREYLYLPMAFEVTQLHLGHVILMKFLQDWT